MDGLDCCYADINIDKNNNLKFEIIKYQTIPFSTIINNNILQVIGSDDKDLIINCHNVLGICFLNIVKEFIGKNEIELISMHGQTISHIDKVKTLQIGNPMYLYEYFNVPVVYDFRTKDLLLGGNGAPLVPYLDWLLSKKYNKNILTLNLGGIANITYIPSDSNRNEVIGFDTGPGMCLIDQFVQLKWNIKFDINGKKAKKGRINQNLLNCLLKHPYITKPFPKSTSREEFDSNYIKEILTQYPKINKYDILRTLVFFTAKSIYINVKFINRNENFILLISGGGANNNMLVADLANLFSKEKIHTSEFFNINIDAKEAFLMAVMGFSRFLNINNNMPSVTGARKYASYGKIYES